MTALIDFLIHSRRMSDPDDKCSTVRSRRFRERQKQLYGDDLVRKHNAVKMKIYRKKRKVAALEQRPSFTRKIAKKHIEGNNNNSSSTTENSAGSSLHDDIYASTTTTATFKEGDVNKSHLVFKFPSTILICGPTFSGKTHFTMRLLENRDVMFTEKIDQIIWCYGIESPQLMTLKQKFPDVLKLHSGLPDLDRLSTLDKSLKRIIVLDDLMNETKGNTVANLFTKGAHHLGFTVIYIVQNVFNQSREMRNIFLNAQYKVLFNNPSDMTQLSILNSRMYPGHPNFLKSVMSAASESGKFHAYIILDLHPRTPSDLRVWTDVFPHESSNVFLPQ